MNDMKFNSYIIDENGKLVPELEDNDMKFDSYIVDEDKLIPEDDYYNNDYIKQEVYEDIVEKSCNKDSYTKPPVKRNRANKTKGNKNTAICGAIILMITAAILSNTVNKSFKNDNRLYEKGVEIKKEEIMDKLQEEGIIKIENGDWVVINNNLGNLSNIESSPINVQVTEDVLNSFKNGEDIKFQDIIENMTYEGIDENGDKTEYHYANRTDYDNINGISNPNDFYNNIKSEAIHIANDSTKRSK